MDDGVKSELSGRRVYRSPRRTRQAAETRLAILAAARELFARAGYTATTVAQIAATAAVSVDTVYATVGRKPALLRRNKVKKSKKIINKQMSKIYR